MSNRNDFIVPDEGAVKRAASVNFHLEPLRPWLDDPQITEVCVNRPGEVFCERASAWEYYAVPNLDYEHLISLGTATARFVDQDISDSRPVLSAILPMGERIQIVRPPACEHGTISVTIRKPSFTRRTLEDYAQQGFFKHVKPICKSLTPFEQELLALKEAGDYMSFLRRAVQLERVIVVAGETGSGKTTLMKALMQEIPFDQRLITIEDVPELFLPDHPNHVHLFYPERSEGRRKRTSDGRHATAELPAHETDAHPACRAARRRDLRFHQRGRVRPWRQHHQLPCRFVRTDFRAAGIDGVAEPPGPPVAI